MCYKDSHYITINDTNIGNDISPYFVAEIGVNHSGSYDKAIKLIDKAKEVGANAVKFQHRSDDLYASDSIDTFDLGAQYIKKEIDRTYLDRHDLSGLIDYSKEIGLSVIVTPFSLKAFEELTEESIDAIKIASCDSYNLEFISKIAAKTDVPLILSTGMSHELEISEASACLKKHYVEHMFLHCSSTYPCSVDDSNISYTGRLKHITRNSVGFSSHTPYIEPALAAVALGASLIEFHLTFDQNDQGSDHTSSLTVDDARRLISSGRLLFRSLGSDKPRQPTQGEINNRVSLGKSLTFNKDMSAGDIITSKDLNYRSPGSGICVTKSAILGTNWPKSGKEK